MQNNTNVYYYRLTLEFFSEEFNMNELKEKLKLAFLTKRAFIPHQESYEKPKRTTMIYKKEYATDEFVYQKKFNEIFDSLVDDFKIVKEYLEKYDGQAELTMFMKYNDVIFGDRLIVSLSPEQMKVLSENNIKFEVKYRTY